jgi:hypothetical protein
MTEVTCITCIGRSPKFPPKKEVTCLVLFLFCFIFLLFCRVFWRFVASNKGSKKKNAAKKSIWDLGSLHGGYGLFSFVFFLLPRVVCSVLLIAFFGVSSKRSKKMRQIVDKKIAEDFLVKKKSS